MRKPEWAEMFMISFAVYIWFTLMVDADLFLSGIEKNSTSVYSTYIEMVGSQRNLAWLSLAVAVIVFTSLYIKKDTYLIFVAIIGFSYHMFITASFLINYPNIAFGIMSLFGVWLGARIYRLIDVSEEKKKEKILLKSEYHYEENEGGGKIEPTEQNTKER